MLKRISRPSPSFALSLLALFVSLSGTAVAAGVVPLARHALVADNAKKLQGRTPAQMVALASVHSQLADNANLLQGKSVNDVVSMAQAKSISSYFTLKQGTFSMSTAPGPSSARTLELTLPCDAGQKVVSGGFQFSQAPAYMDESGPTSDGTGWHLLLENDSTANGAFGNTYVICVG
jgi:hypothetical protein